MVKKQIKRWIGNEKTEDVRHYLDYARLLAFWSNRPKVYLEKTAPTISR